MTCCVCGAEITRDMTDINGSILYIPRTKKDLYMCLDCENIMRVDWDEVIEQEANVLRGIHETA